MKIKKCARRLLLVVGVLGLTLGASGLEVVTSPGTAMWQRLHTTSVTLSWDWTWEWVPAEAVSVRVTVRGARRGFILDKMFPREGVTTTTFDIGAVTATSEDVYDATLMFRAPDGEVLATRTVDLHALAGSFGTARVCTRPTDHADWRCVARNALVPYDVAWADSVATTVEQLAVTPTGREAFELPVGRTSGVLAVRGFYETTLALSFGADAAPLTADLYWNVPGLMLLFK